MHSNHIIKEFILFANNDLNFSSILYTNMEIERARNNSFSTSNEPHSHWTDTEMVFSHNFTPQCATFWNDRVIVSNKKYMFNQQWFDHNSLVAHDILGSNGEVLQLDDLKSKFNI